MVYLGIKLVTRNNLYSFYLNVVFNVIFTVVERQLTNKHLLRILFTQ